MSLDFKLEFKKLVKDEQETSELVKSLLPYLKKDSILLLSGDLGAGKTTSVRYLCEHLGIKHVQSPTYAIHQRHVGKNMIVDHVDLYRLQSEEELVSTGFWDLLQATDSLMIIEWYERIPTQDWLEFEKDRRSVFGLKIETETSSQNRIFQFFKLQAN